MHNSFILQQYVCYTTILNLFQAARCSSSGGPVVSPQPLVSSPSVNSRTVCRWRADCIKLVICKSLVHLVWFILVHYNPLIYVMLTVDVVIFFPPLKKTCTEHNRYVSCRFESVIWNFSCNVVIFNGLHGKIISDSYWLLWHDICSNWIILAVVE